MNIETGSIKILSSMRVVTRMVLVLGVEGRILLLGYKEI